METNPPLLVIPGIDGFPNLFRDVEERLFAGLHPTYFNHSADRAGDGLEALSQRALVSAAAAFGTDQRFLVCGESFGGTVALTLARQLPERVRGLILLATFAFYPPRSVTQLGMRAWDRVGDRVAGHILRATHRFGIKSALGKAHTPQARSAYLALPRPDIAALRAKSAISMAFDARPWLGEITCPALVMGGARDVVVPHAAGLELAAGLPQARLHRLPEGHIAHFVWPEQANAVIRDWLRAVPV